MGFIDDVLEEAQNNAPGGKIVKGVLSTLGIGGSKLDNLFFESYRDPVYKLLRTKWDEKTQWGPVAIKYSIGHADVKQGKNSAYYLAAWNRLFSFIEDFLNQQTPGWGNYFTYLNFEYARLKPVEDQWKMNPVLALQEVMSNPKTMGEQTQSKIPPASSGSTDTGDGWFSSLTGNAFDVDLGKLGGILGLKPKSKLGWLGWVAGGVAVVVFLVWIFKLIFGKRKR